MALQVWEAAVLCMKHEMMRITIVTFIEEPPLPKQHGFREAVWRGLEREDVPVQGRGWS